MSEFGRKKRANFIGTLLVTALLGGLIPFVPTGQSLARVNNSETGALNQNDIIDFGYRIDGYLARFTGTLNKEGTFTIHYGNGKVKVSKDAIAYVIKENFGNYVIIIDGDKIFTEELSFLNNKDVKLQALTYECVVGKPNAYLYPISGEEPIRLHEGDKVTLVETLVKPPACIKYPQLYDLVYYTDNKGRIVYGKLKRGNIDVEIKKVPTKEDCMPYNLGFCKVKKGTKIHYASTLKSVILEDDKWFFGKRVQGGEHGETIIIVKTPDDTWNEVGEEQILEWDTVLETLKKIDKGSR